MGSNRNTNHPTLKLSGRKTETRGLAGEDFLSLFLHPGPTLLAAPSPVPPLGGARIFPVPDRAVHAAAALPRPGPRPPAAVLRRHLLVVGGSAAAVPARVPPLGVGGGRGCLRKKTPGVANTARPDLGKQQAASFGDGWVRERDRAPGSSLSGWRWKSRQAWAVLKAPRKASRSGRGKISDLKQPWGLKISQRIK